MKPSKRYEWLLLYSLVWTMMVLTTLWMWGNAVTSAEARLMASVALVVGDLLIVLFIWWRYEPDGKKKERKTDKPAGAPGAGPGAADVGAAAKAAAGKVVSVVKSS